MAYMSSWSRTVAGESLLQHMFSFLGIAHTQTEIGVKAAKRGIIQRVTAFSSHGPRNGSRPNAMGRPTSYHRPPRQSMVRQLAKPSVVIPLQCPRRLMSPLRKPFGSTPLSVTNISSCIHFDTFEIITLREVSHSSRSLHIQQLRFSSKSGQRADCPTLEKQLRELRLAKICRQPRGASRWHDHVGRVLIKCLGVLSCPRSRE